MTPCGTVGYTAPEIVKDERYTTSVDMWALGCVLYTLECGFPPFYDESINVLTEKVAKGYYTFLAPWWDDISGTCTWRCLHCESYLADDYITLCSEGSDNPFAGSGPGEAIYYQRVLGSSLVQREFLRCSTLLDMNSDALEFLGETCIQRHNTRPSRSHRPQSQTHSQIQPSPRFTSPCRWCRRRSTSPPFTWYRLSEGFVRYILRHQPYRRRIASTSQSWRSGRSSRFPR